MIIEIYDGDTNLDENTKQSKKLLITNEGYIIDHENKKENMFDVFFLSDEYYFLINKMTKYNIVSLIP